MNMNAIKIGMALLGLLAQLLSGVESGQFSSNIVMLNSRNWRKEVEEYGHAVFVNVWWVRRRLLKRKDELHCWICTVDMTVIAILHFYLSLLFATRFTPHSRSGWGYCQLLHPEWEELATKVKGLVKIAYWDTEKSGAAPSILGEIRGTPTIKLLRPKRKAKTNRQKDVVDYNMDRKADDSKWGQLFSCSVPVELHLNEVYQ